jgi:hypothetical protein
MGGSEATTPLASQDAAKAERNQKDTISHVVFFSAMR